MTARELARLGCALLLGAALAFPVGLTVARWGDSAGAPDARVRASDAQMRDMFSPTLRGDPWFLARQREGVEALERHCARTGESCAEARGARARLAEIEAAE